jgi:uridine kinase
MLGDILLITDAHRKVGEQILDQIQAVEAEKFVLAISGESGSGKSELAHVVARSLKDEGRLAKIIHTDNYYKIPPRERRSWRKAHGLTSVGLDEYDWERLEAHVQAFRRDERAELPCIDLLTDQEDLLITEFKGISGLLLEGLYAIRAPADRRVFIDLTYRETKVAQILRGKEPPAGFR